MGRLPRRQFPRTSNLAAAGTVVAAWLPTTPAPARPAAGPTATTVRATSVPSPTAPAAPTAEYAEAPFPAERIASGALAAVDERLPENPLVIEDLDGIGNFSSCGLLRIDRTMAMVSGLAESWSVSADAAAWTFTLRRGSSGPTAIR